MTQYFTRQGLEADARAVAKLRRLEAHFVPEHLQNADEAEVSRRAMAGEINRGNSRSSGKEISW